MERDFALIMKLWWIVTVFVSFLSFCATRVVTLPSGTVAETSMNVSSDAKSSDEFEKKFVSFDAKSNNTKNLQKGAFINVPVNCPWDKVKVGNRCRAFF